MKCTKVTRSLPALLAGELPADEARELERHLAFCPGCREARAALEADSRLLCELDTPEPGPWLTGRVMAAVRAASRRAGRPAWVRALAAAGTVLLVAAGVWFGTTLGGDLFGGGASADPLAVNGEPSLTEYVELAAGSTR